MHYYVLDLFSLSQLRTNLQIRNYQKVTKICKFFGKVHVEKQAEFKKYICRIIKLRTSLTVSKARAILRNIKKTTQERTARQV